MLHSRSSTWRRAVRALHHAVFHESRQGRAVEIAGWSNAASALGVAAAVTYFGWSRLPVHAAWIGLVAGAVTLVVLRLALAHRLTVWVAAAMGTLSVAAFGGGLAWLFAHVLEVPSAPSIGAVLGAVLAALAPAWSYAHLAGRRAANVRDSLVDPVSARPSR